VTHTPLGPGSEFDLVRRLAARWGERAAGLGDDAAVLDVPAGERLVVSTDAFVEDVHVRRGWLLPREIGWRATAAALSDLAAMAARPLGIVVAVALPESWLGDAEEIADGIGEAAAYAGTQVIGGDTTRAPQLSLTVTVLGSAARPLLRTGARPGDRVWVTGALGGPLAALRDLQRGVEPLPFNRARFAHPEPRIREAQWLAGRGATAAIDISDGLAADARHLAAASGVRLRLDLDQLPLHEEIDPRTGAWSASEHRARPAAALLDAARSGEEYELLVTAPGPLDVAEFTARFGVRLTEIGVVSEAGDLGAGIETRIAGERVDPPAGHDHLSR
jgi:thiamine-monophosphate kinase